MAVQDQDPLQAEILREVAEEIRDEQYKKLWKKIGPYITAVIIALLAAAAGYEYYKYDKHQTELKESFELQDALVMLRDGNVKDAEASLKDMSQNAKSGYRFLAAMHYAGVLAEQNNSEEAVAVLNELATNSETPAPLQAVALLNKVALAADLENADYKALTAELAPMTDPNSPWAADALELTALMALRQNDNEKAKAALQSIVGLQNIPDAVRQRASENLTLLNAAK